MVILMVMENVQTAPRLSHEKRTNLVDELWSGIRAVVNGIDRLPQREELILELEKYSTPRQAVSLRRITAEDSLGEICLD